MLGHSRYSCSDGSIWLCKRFLSLTGIKGASCSLFSFCKFLNCSFASGYPGLCDRGGACLSSSTLRRLRRCIFFSLLLRRNVEDTELYNVILVSNPSIRPIHLSQIDVNTRSPFCSASKCITSFEVMQLPWILSTFGTSCRDWRCTKRCFRNLQGFLDSVDRVRVEL